MDLQVTGGARRFDGTAAEFVAADDPTASTTTCLEAVATGDGQKRPAT
jgi:hypothetical protein